MAVPRGGKIAEGIRLGHGPRKTSETYQPHQGAPLPAADARTSPSKVSAPRVVRVNAPAPTAAPAPAPAQRQPSPERTDALTKKPLDFEQEEETRKLETSRWLESHFGSESSHSSSDPADSDPIQSPAPAEPIMPSQIKSGGINVTMVSKSPTWERDEVDADFQSSPPPAERTRKYSPPTHMAPSDDIYRSYKSPASPAADGYRGYGSPVPVAPSNDGSRIYATPIRPAQSPSERLSLGDKFFFKNRQSPAPPVYQVDIHYYANLRLLGTPTPLRVDIFFDK